MKDKVVHSTTLEGCYAWVREGELVFDHHSDAESCSKAILNVDRGHRAPDCQTLLSELVPASLHGKRGRWTVTVEFEAYDEGAKN